MKKSLATHRIAKTLLFIFAATGAATFFTACSTPAQRQDARVDARVENRVDNRRDRWN